MKIKCFTVCTLLSAEPLVGPSIAVLSYITVIYHVDLSYMQSRIVLWRLVILNTRVSENILQLGF